MSDVFISYAKEDQAGAKILVDVLTEQGWSVWWDREIPPGKTWDEAIGKEIKAASCVIVLWSKASVASKWVFNEAMKGKERKILLPVLIEQGVEIPPEFGLIQATDFTGWDGQRSPSELDSLLKEVRALLARRVRRRRVLWAGFIVFCAAFLTIVVYAIVFFLPGPILTGQVVEEGTGAPIVGAQVTVLENRGTDTTDEKGFFHIEVQGNPYDYLEVSVWHPEYNDKNNKIVGLALAEDHLISLKRNQ